MTGQRGRRHLTAGHTVVGVIDENDREMLTAGSGGNDFAHAHRGKVAITLIGKDYLVGQGALDARRHRRRASVRGFDEIKVEVVVRKDSAAHRSNADGVIQLTHFFEHFRDQPVRHTMGAAGQ